MSKVVRKTTDLGTERLCKRCGEFWPEDDTFWFYDKHGWVMTPCRACWSERKHWKAA